MRRLIAWLGTGQLGPSVIKFLSGVAGAQILLLLCAPLLGRIYSPGEFGAFGVFIALVSMCVTLATLRYEMSIVIARSSEVRFLFWGTAMLALLASCICGCVYWICSPIVEATLPTDDLRAAGYLFPAAVGVQALMLTATRLASKHSRFGGMALALFAGRTADITVKLALSSLLTWQGLAIGMIVGDFVTLCGVLTLAGRHSLLPPAWRHRRRFAYVFRKYLQFPIYNLPATFCSNLTNALPMLALASLFGPAAAGAFELARRVVGRPSSIVGNHFHTVFYQSASDQLNETGSVANLVERLLPTFALLFAIPFLLIGLFGPQLFTIYLGPDWALAGAFAAILAPAWFARSIANPIRLFNTLGRQRLAFVWQLGLLGCLLIAVGIGCLFQNVVLLVTCLSAAMFVAYLIQIGLTIRLSGASLGKIGHRLLNPRLIGGFRVPTGKSAELRDPTHDAVARLENTKEAA